MEDFVSEAAARLGISEDASRSVTGGLLSLIKRKADGADFGQLIEKIPGAQSVLQHASQGTESNDGIVGGLLGKVTSAFGGSPGSGVGLAAIFKKSGLDMDDAGEFVSNFTGYLRERAGGDLIGRVLGKLPELKSLVS